jgi:hypothetical protein
MTVIDRTTWRVANAIHDQLAVLQMERLGEIQPVTSRLGDSFHRFRTLRNQMVRARRRGFVAAERKLHARLQRLLAELSAEADSALRHAQRFQPEPVTKTSEIVAALKQLDNEFGGWSFDRQTRRLFVTTEPIVLEGIDLGRFDIVLCLDDLPLLDRRAPYEVIARDPNPAAGSPSVTHPHVSDQQLCEGEANRPIRRALSSGRVCEFFMLVTSVLRQYNRESPYVALEEWEGEPCSDCGYRAGEEHIDRCEDCGAVVCTECISTCSDCEKHTCYRCLATCEQCDELICIRCTYRCEGCRAIVCAACVTDGLCEECETQRQKESDDGNEDQQQQSEAERQDQQAAPASAETGAGRADGEATGRIDGHAVFALHAHGVGEADVAQGQR